MNDQYNENFNMYMDSYEDDLKTIYMDNIENEITFMEYLDCICPFDNSYEIDSKEYQAWYKNIKENGFYGFDLYDFMLDKFLENDSSYLEYCENEFKSFIKQN